MAVRERDVQALDDFDLPDIPDVDEADDEEMGAPSADGLDGEGDEGEQGEPSPPGPVARALAPLLAIVGRVGQAASPLVARLAPIAAPLAAATAPIGNLLGPFLRRVPAAIWAGLGSFAAVVLVVALVGALLGGGTPAATAAATPKAGAAEKKTTAAAPKPTPRPLATPKPVATVTATPGVFRRQSRGWLAVGAPAPEPRHRLPADLLHLVDSPGERFSLVARIRVLLRVGDLSPWWGIVLAYAGENEHTRLEFFTDRYDGDRPYVALVTTRDGKPTAHGPSIRMADIDYWGRESHEIRVAADDNLITLWLNKEPVHQWPNPRLVPSARKGMYVWGGTRLLVDTFEVQ